jgi:hypothetical protein
MLAAKDTWEQVFAEGSDAPKDPDDPTAEVGR